MSEFLHCLDLCNSFYHEVVQPVLDSTFPSLPYGAAVIGRGSEVLGLDDEMSSDHDWGPRVMLFLNEEDYSRSSDAVLQALGQPFRSRSSAASQQERSITTASGCRPSGIGLPTTPTMSGSIC
jgi:hypothetical protein